MGRPKMALPWGDTTVLGHVISVYAAVLGRDNVLVVTGGSRNLVEGIAAAQGVRAAFNGRYASEGMLSSIRTGLAAIGSGFHYALICLGDQPQITARSVRLICEAAATSHASLVVPSFGNRRGHPWAIADSLWADAVSNPGSGTPQDFLRSHSSEIYYVAMDTAEVIQDLDTPEDYGTQRPATEGM